MPLAMSTDLKFGLFLLNTCLSTGPTAAARIARLAESSGFDSIWAPEHVVLPDPRVRPSPMDPDEPILDPLIALAFLAAHTTSLRLGTGIVILPQRNPLVLAKQVASLDSLSQGRLILGVGAGYLEPEMSAIGVPMAERGGRTDEFLAAMDQLWYEQRPAYAGRFVRFSGVTAYPRPRRVPIVVGGESPAAHRRAIQRGHGWYGFALDLAQTAAQLEGLRHAEACYERPLHLGPLEVSVTPTSTPDRATAQRYAELGVHRLILRPGRELDEAGLVSFVTETSRTLIAP